MEATSGRQPTFYRKLARDVDWIEKFVCFLWDRWVTRKFRLSFYLWVILLYFYLYVYICFLILPQFIVTYVDAHPRTIDILLRSFLVFLVFLLGANDINVTRVSVCGTD